MMECTVRPLEQMTIYLLLGESAKTSEGQALGGESHTVVTQETTLSVATDFPNHNGLKM